MANLKNGSRVFGNLDISGKLTAASTLNSVQVLTSGSGATYTAPSGLKFALVIATGGAGGGGGADGA
jgi:hypothetical protein